MLVIFDGYKPLEKSIILPINTYSTEWVYIYYRVPTFYSFIYSINILKFLLYVKNYYMYFGYSSEQDRSNLWFHRTYCQVCIMVADGAQHIGTYEGVIRALKKSKQDKWSEMTRGYKDYLRLGCLRCPVPAPKKDLNEMRVWVMRSPKESIPGHEKDK